MIDVVIFDCDGVLIDSELIGAEVEARVLAAYGIEIDAESLHRRFLGRTTQAMLEELKGEATMPFPDNLDDRLQAELDRAFETGLTAMPAIHEAIEQVDRLGVRRCVASSSTYDRLRTTLGLTDLYDLFAPHIFSAQSVPNGKPAPDLFLHAAASMGVEPPRCLVVEDSENGVRAGVAAGMTTVGFTGGSHRDRSDGRALLALGAREVLDDITGVAALVAAFRSA